MELRFAALASSIRKIIMMAAAIDALKVKPTMILMVNAKNAEEDFTTIQVMDNATNALKISSNTTAGATNATNTKNLTTIKMNAITAPWVRSIIAINATNVQRV